MRYPHLDCSALERVRTAQDADGGARARLDAVHEGVRMQEAGHSTVEVQQGAPQGGRDARGEKEVARRGGDPEAV